MKYLFWIALIIFVSCNNQRTSESKYLPEPSPVDTAKLHSDEPQPPPMTYIDNITPLSMSNSLDRANVNDNLTIYVQVKNTGNDICNLCNVGIRYSLKDITGTTASDKDITDGSFAITNLLPGQVGTIEIKFPITQTGNYTFYLTDLFGVFNGTHSTKHLNVPGDAKTYLTVL